jgi:preprotein translocase subunit SecY
VITALANAFKIPELRKKILFTLAILALYRIGAHIPVPGVDPAAVKAATEAAGSGVLGLLNLFSGGALQRFAIFSLGIMPYITATIIMQLLTAVIPKVEQWSKEGESGQRKITQVSRYMTLGIGLMESIGFIALFQSPPPNGLGITFNWTTRIVILISLLAGTALIMWMGELITQRGIGNGMSLMIFASIIARFPSAIWQAFSLSAWYMVLLVVVIFLFVVAAIVTMEKAQRRIPVQYAKRIVGRKVYGGAGTYIPLKINGANVIPIIFASAVLAFPSTITQFFTNSAAMQSFTKLISPGSWLYLVLFALLIIFFTYFYTALVFNPIDLADNLRKQGGFIPGVRPGKNTVVFIENVLNRINLPGALFLAVIAVGPTILFSTTNVVSLQQFGGTSILIMVGVALETMNQLESQLKMRHYDGFFK